MTITETITALEEEQKAILQLADPIGREERIGGKLSAFNRSTFGGYGPLDVMAAKDRDLRIEDDEAIRTRAAQYRQNMRESERAFRSTIALVSKPQDPLREDLQHLQPEARELRQIRLEQARERAERQLVGKSYAQVQLLLESADDIRDAVLVHLIADQDERGWPDVELKPDPKDVLAPNRLKAALAKRERARLEQHHPELVALEQRFRKLDTATMEMLTRHLVDDQRGLAYTRDRSGVITIDPDARGTAVRERTRAMI
jgi:hypothetical protein